MRKTLDFIQEVATIMYVGGILSHIVIGAAIGHPDAETALTVYRYKEISANILILPGLGLKLAVDIALWFGCGVRANWLKVTFVMMAFLTVNAFLFLVPMTPEMVALAETSLADGIVSQAFLNLGHTEQLIGMSNVLPLICELVMGAFKPRLFGERRTSMG